MGLIFHHLRYRTVTVYFYIMPNYQAFVFNEKVPNSAINEGRLTMFNNSYIALILTASFMFVDSVAAPLEDFKKGPYYDPSSPNKEEMLNYGKALKDHRVREVFFVHGTFVGTDGSGFVSILKGFNMNLGRSVKKQKDEVLGDVGNYTESYVNDFCQLIDNGICLGAIPSRFEWSSGNNHKARLQGAIKLIETLAEQIHTRQIQDDDRILLIGHSHAGQVFALLTNLLADGQQARMLYEFIDRHQGKIIEAGTKEEHSKAITQLKANLTAIKKVNLDFVTFGTPVRYEWGTYPKFRLMSVINYRRPTTSLGVYKVRDGDYVQQWGVEGTDTLLPTEKNIENELSDILGDKGNDPQEFQNSLTDNSRRKPKNMSTAINYLVDYRDDNPNFIDLDFGYALKKVFGHGVYTTQQAMQYNTKLIIDTLYTN